MVVKIEKIIRTSHDTLNPRLDISCYGKYVKGKFTQSAEVSDCGFYAFENLPFIGKKQKKLIEKVLREERDYFVVKKPWYHRFTQALLRGNK